MDELDREDGASSPILFPYDDENTGQFEKEKMLLKKIRHLISGIPPPPRLTVSLLSASEIIDRWNANVSAYDFPHCEDKSEFYFLNKSQDSEDIASLSQKIQERYIHLETMSTCSLSFQSCVARIQARKNKDGKARQGLSPGRRLSHLAKRRQIFSYNNLMNMSLQQGPSQSTDRRVISLRGNQKQRLNKTLSPSGSVKKRLNGSKRALFTSPDKLSNTEIKKRLLKRKLFSSSEKKKPLSVKLGKINIAKKSPASAKKRKLEHSGLSNERIVKCPRRSLTFDNDDTSQSSMKSDDSKTDNFKSSSKNSLTEINKKKLVWAVFNILKEEKISKDNHSLYKSCFKDLLALCRSNIKEILCNKRESGTTAKMLSFARNHVGEILNKHGCKRAVDSSQPTDTKKSDDPVITESQLDESVESPVFRTKKQRREFMKIFSQIHPAELELCKKTPRKKTYIQHRIVQTCRKTKKESLVQDVPMKLRKVRSFENMCDKPVSDRRVMRDWLDPMKENILYYDTQEVIYETSSMASEVDKELDKFPYLNKAKPCQWSLGSRDKIYDQYPDYDSNFYLEDFGGMINSLVGGATSCDKVNSQEVIEIPSVKNTVDILEPVLLEVNTQSQSWSVQQNQDNNLISNEGYTLEKNAASNDCLFETSDFSNQMIRNMSPATMFGTPYHSSSHINASKRELIETSFTAETSMGTSEQIKNDLPFQSHTTEWKYEEIEKIAGSEVTQVVDKKLDEGVNVFNNENLLKVEITENGLSKPTCVSESQEMSHPLYCTPACNPDSNLAVGTTVSQNLDLLNNSEDTHFEVKNLLQNSCDKMDFHLQDNCYEVGHLSETLKVGELLKNSYIKVESESEDKPEVIHGAEEHKVEVTHSAEEEYRQEVSHSAEKHKPEVAHSPEGHKPEVVHIAEEHRPNVTKSAEEHKPEVVHIAEELRLEVTKSAEEHKPAHSPEEHKPEVVLIAEVHRPEVGLTHSAEEQKAGVGDSAEEPRPEISHCAEEHTPKRHCAEENKPEVEYHVTENKLERTLVIMKHMTFRETHESCTSNNIDFKSKKINCVEEKCTLVDPDCHSEAPREYKSEPCDHKAEDTSCAQECESLCAELEPEGCAHGNEMNIVAAPKHHDDTYLGNTLFQEISEKSPSKKNNKIEHTESLRDNEEYNSELSNCEHELNTCAENTKIITADDREIESVQTADSPIDQQDTVNSKQENFQTDGEDDFVLEHTICDENKLDIEDQRRNAAVEKVITHQQVTEIKLSPITTTSTPVVDKTVQQTGIVSSDINYVLNPEVSYIQDSLHHTNNVSYSENILDDKSSSSSETECCDETNKISNPVNPKKRKRKMLIRKKAWKVVNEDELKMKFRLSTEWQVVNKSLDTSTSGLDLTPNDSRELFNSTLNFKKLNGTERDLQTDNSLKYSDISSTSLNSTSAGDISVEPNISQCRTSDITGRLQGRTKTKPVILNRNFSPSSVVSKSRRLRHDKKETPTACSESPEAETTHATDYDTFLRRFSQGTEPSESPRLDVSIGSESSRNTDSMSIRSTPKQRNSLSLESYKRRRQERQSNSAEKKCYEIRLKHGWKYQNSNKRTEHRKRKRESSSEEDGSSVSSKIRLSKIMKSQARKLVNALSTYKNLVEDHIKNAHKASPEQEKLILENVETLAKINQMTRDFKECLTSPVFYQCYQTEK